MQTAVMACMSHQATTISGPMKGSSCCNRENRGLGLRAGARLCDAASPDEDPFCCRLDASLLLLLLLDPAGCDEGPAVCSLRELLAVACTRQDFFRIISIWYGTLSIGSRCTVAGIYWHRQVCSLLQYQTV